MYISSINIYNIGPIDKCNIKSKFDENGNPYPIIIIGDNGKGKTILSSYIADAMIELAKSNSTYNNIVEHEGAYYKIIGQTNIKNGKEYGVTVISFKDNDKYFSYIEKAGNIKIEECHNDLITLPNKDIVENMLKSNRKYKKYHKC